MEVGSRRQPGEHRRVGRPRAGPGCDDGVASRWNDGPFMGLTRPTRPPMGRPRGVRFHPGALRDDVVIPLYDRPGTARGRTGGAGAEWSDVAAVLGRETQTPANATEPCEREAYPRCSTASPGHAAYGGSVW